MKKTSHLEEIMPPSSDDDVSDNETDCQIYSEEEQEDHGNDTEDESEAIEPEDDEHVESVIRDDIDFTLNAAPRAALKGNSYVFNLEDYVELTLDESIEFLSNPKGKKW